MELSPAPKTDVLLQTIQACPDLQWSTPDQHLALALRSQHILLEAGEHLFHKGDRGESIYLLIGGDLEIYAPRPNKAENLVLARLFRKGDSLGEWAATRKDQSRSASVKARRDSSLLEIPYSLIREVGAFTKFLGHSARRGEKLETHDDLAAQSPLLNLMTRQGSSRLNYEERTIPAGETIFNRGDRSEEVFLIIDGTVEIFIHPEEVLSSLSQDQIFGELGVTQGAPRSASARTKSDCRLLVLNAGDFLNLARSNPEIASHMLTLRKIYRTRLYEVVLQFQYQIAGQPCISSTMNLDDDRQLITDFSASTDAVSMEVVPQSADAMVFSYEDKSRNIHRQLEISKGVICAARFRGPTREAGRIVESIRNRTVISAAQLQQFEEKGAVFDIKPAQTVLCHCMQITRTEIGDIKSDFNCSLEELMQLSGAGTVCGGCRGDLAEICHSDDSQQMELLEVTEIQPGFCRVRFTPGSGISLTPFTAGQHILVEAVIDGELVRRSYTLTSPASETSWREITLKREAHGIFTRWLSAAKPGSETVRVSHPTGNFTADMNVNDPVILLVGGIGVTPALSIVRTRTELEKGPRIIVDHSFHTYASGPCHEELQQISDLFPDIEYHPRETLGGQRIRRRHLEKYYSAYPAARWMICGPESYEQGMQQHLEEMGIPKQSISQELFHARGSTGAGSIPEDQLSAVIGIAATIVTAITLGMDLLPQELKTWQQSFSGRWISGGSLMTFLGWQWILPLQRIRRSTGDSANSLQLHRRIGAFSPLLLLLHGSTIGAGLLGLISILFLTHTVIGVADRSLISNPDKQRGYLKIWLYPHIVISILLTVLALFHVWLILGHGGPS